MYHSQAFTSAFRATGVSENLVVKKFLLVLLHFCQNMEPFELPFSNGPALAVNQSLFACVTLQIYTVFNCVHFPLQSRCMVYIFCYIQSNVEVTGDESEPSWLELKDFRLGSWPFPFSSKSKIGPKRAKILILFFLLCS